jgi:hypothetical protein
MFYEFHSLRIRRGKNKLRFIDIKSYNEVEKWNKQIKSKIIGRRGVLESRRRVKQKIEQYRNRIRRNCIRCTWQYSEYFLKRRKIWIADLKKWVVKINFKWSEEEGNLD